MLASQTGYFSFSCYNRITSILASPTGKHKSEGTKTSPWQELSDDWQDIWINPHTVYLSVCHLKRIGTGLSLIKPGCSWTSHDTVENSQNMNAGSTNNIHFENLLRGQSMCASNCGNNQKRNQTCVSIFSNCKWEQAAWSLSLVYGEWSFGGRTLLNKSWYLLRWLA